MRTALLSLLLLIAPPLLAAEAQLPRAPAIETPLAGAPPTEVPQIQEWPVPWSGTRPRDPDVDNHDHVWFVGQRGNYLGRFSPSTRKFTRIDLPPGTAPHNLIVHNGRIWFAGNGAAYIGRYDPLTEQMDRFPMPDPAAADPHTLVTDDRGSLWFTVQGGNFVGRLDLLTEQITLLPVPTRGARPYGIVVDGRGRPWFTEFGSHKLASIDPESMTLHEHELPRAEARPRRLAAGGDHIWYVDFAEGYLGRYTPATGKAREWPVPGGEQAQPYGMTIDGEGRLWFVETGRQPNRLVGFNPASETFYPPVPLPSGGGSVRHMTYDAEREVLWFGTDADTLGRAQLPVD